MSFHDQLMAEYAVPAHVEHFAERDANGDFGGVKYWPADAADGAEGVPWVASVGDLVQEAPNSDGSGTHEEQERREVVTLSGPSPATPFVRNGLLQIARYEGERFRIDQIDRGAVMTTVRAYRYLTERLQRRGVERDQ